LETFIIVLFLLGIVFFDFLPKRGKMRKRERWLYLTVFCLCAVFLILFSAGVTPPNFPSAFWFDWIRSAFHLN